jgi:DNA-binding transcriptional LysR family regulator
MSDQDYADLDWGDIRVFLALARHGTLSAAARAISVNHTTIARRVRALEAKMGEKLVERRPDGFVLTSAGTRMLEPANDMEVAASRMRRIGAEDSPKGLVRVNGPPSLTQAFLVPRLAKLSVHNPGLDVDAATDFRNISLERREADIALRFGRPLDGDVIAKQLPPIGFGFYATPAVRRAIDGGAQPVFVAFDEANSHVPEALWLARQFPRARVSFRGSSGIAQATAAASGAGIALVPHFIGNMHRELGLCRLEHDPPARPLWLITRRQDRKSPEIAAVSGYLVKAFTEERSYFSAYEFDRAADPMQMPSPR